jgi:sialate O-acetylesterase
MAIDCAQHRPSADCGDPAGFRVDGYHGHGMVVQRNHLIHIRGRSAPQAIVDGWFGAACVSTTADGDGLWHLEFPAQPAGGPYTVAVRCGQQIVEFDDVWVGEVWLCVGQSNLVWPFSYIPAPSRAGYLRLIAGWDVRVLRVPERPFAEAGKQLPAMQWNNYTEDQHADLPALPTLLGHLLASRLDCKVGIVVSAIAGTRSCSWIPREAFHEDEFLSSYLRDYPADPPEYSQHLEYWQRDKAAFQALNAARERKGEKPLPLTKYIFWGPRGTRSLAYPGGAFEAMVRPLTHVPVRGIVWYQGESEAEIPYGYADRLRLLMRHWSAAWKRQAGQAQLNFVLVQLPGYNGDFEAKNWPHLREQQQLAAAGHPYAYCLPTTDLGEDSELHPADKFAFAQRIAPSLAAISAGSAPQQAPNIASYTIETATDGEPLYLLVRISAPLAPRAEPLCGFEIVDTHGCAMAAEAVFIDPTLIRVRVPIAAFAFHSLRYNWQPFPTGRLSSRDSALPLLPFRSDSAPPPYRASSHY